MMAQKVVILGSHECPTCAELKEMMDKSGQDFEYVDLDSEEGLAKAEDLSKRGLRMEDFGIPKCIIDYGDKFGFCDEKDLYERLKKQFSQPSS